MRLQDKIIFTLLFGFILFISLNRYSRHPRFDYHAQLWADKAGYQVYLPAFFYYDMDGGLMPDSIGYNTGQGFRIQNSKVITKYPIGVAVLQAPFFGVAAVLDAAQGVTTDLGFTENQHLATNWSSAVYGVFGLIFLYLVAVRFWKLSRGRAYFLVGLVLGCSNLLYYLTRDGGLSHSYSFFCFTLFLYLVYSLVYVRMSYFGITKALVVLLVAVSIRHVNAAFLIIPILYFLHQYWGEWKKLQLLNVIKSIGLALLIGVWPLVLQLLYHQYAFGSFGASGYADEAFSNLMNMQLIDLWFAPHNGALLYSPVLLLVLGAIVYTLRENRKNVYFLVLFFAISLLYAAWWTPQLGCGFGNRGFTEFLAFFSIPLAAVIRRWSISTVKFALVIGICCTVFLFILQWNFDGCWYGEGNWDWAEYWRLIRG